MNPATIVAIINGVLSVAGAVIPLIPASGGSASMGKLLEMLTGLAPLITDQVGVVYTGVKNIIASMGSHPATTAAQLEALAAFDKQVDDAWNAIEKQLDPDTPASA
jgi:hypothetical protein